MSRRARDTEPPGTTIAPLDADGRVRSAELSDLVDDLTPDGEATLIVLLTRLVEINRETTPEVREALAAKASRDRTRAVAWDALATVVGSKWSVPAYTILVAALSLGGLELVGVDLTSLPAIISAAKQCP